MNKIKVEKVIITIGNASDESASVYIETVPPISADTDVAEDTPSVVLATAIMNFLQEEGDTEEEVLH